MSMDTIFGEIAREREYQDEKWGGAGVDDAENGKMEWVAYITHYATKWFPGGFPPYDLGVEADFRTKMVKVAALAVAAIEQHDRVK